MSQIQKRIAKLNKKPIPNDITFEDVEALARYYGCEVLSGGKHGTKIGYPPLGKIIPIPRHGNTVQEAYVEQLKELFSRIEEEKQ